MGECGEGFVGDFVEAADVAAVLAAELCEPDIGAFGDEDDGGHPGLVWREALVFVGGVAEDGDVRVALGKGAFVSVASCALGSLFFRGD